MEIAWLGEPEAHDPALVGGKAASLSRLAAEHRVPPGFVLTSKALGLAAPDLARGIVPEPLRAYIDEAYSRLGGGKVAVRSSAIDEDGDAHSFAGQHETFLNVEGVEAIAEAVVLCFASAFTARQADLRRVLVAARRQVDVAEGEANRGIALRPLDVDVTFVAGYGFPRHRGGPMKYADMTGLPRVLADIREFAKEDPLFWQASPLLVNLVENGQNFDSLSGRGFLITSLAICVLLPVGMGVYFWKRRWL